MNNMSIKDAERHFNKLLQAVRAGQTIVLTDGDVEIATVAPRETRSDVDNSTLRQQFDAFRRSTNTNISIAEILEWKHESHRY
jgi:antitoxin (DNA-binding transcriptional repressor) of toxin-antitoxin stability system